MPEKKKIGAGRLVLYFFLFLVFLRACGAVSLALHEHRWQDATCTAPKTCARCHERVGESLGHDWTEATCTEPEHCARCGKDRHWYSLALGHDWQDATCTEPKTCARCGATEGEPQHRFISYDWDTTVEPTCQTEGEASHACMLCGAVETKVLPVVAHQPGDWQVVTAATPSADGVKARYCVWCGAEVDTRSYAYVPPAGGGGGSGGGGSGGGDGNNFYAHDNPGQQDTSSTYVLNTSTMVFHRPSCRDVRRIAPQNYATTNRSRASLLADGWQGCGHCSP